MVDSLVGADESKARQIENCRARLSQCMETGKVGFVFTEMYSPKGPIKLQGPRELQGPEKMPDSDFDRVFGGISEEVLAILSIDNMTGYLIVDCSGREGSRTPRSIADKMAAILNERENKNSESPLRGTFFPSYCPAPVSAEEADIRILGEAALHTQKLELLKDVLTSDPTRVTPLLFSKFPQ